MTRTRQRGKRVALAAFRRSCNRDLLDPKSHVRDFEPIFLDEYLDDLLVADQRANDADASAEANEVNAQLLR